MGWSKSGLKDRGAKRAGAKNNLTNEHNALPEQVLPDFQLVLKQNNGQNLERGNGLLGEHSKFIKDRITELLKNAEFLQPGENGGGNALKETNLEPKAAEDELSFMAQRITKCNYLAFICTGESEGGWKV
ncbi:hypothetical protein BT96DRAFT_950919 [Gymnopus androsaceus JB14]|uniref:Uncharacterized protein n=1 Tax=Gymnopus androsaceus JB14 TaxID=1447944 RepID=A0A6A4GEW1_9AGAR|nr:hypothetical protein BT96DRAFT_950919 [Gymnopus androsaceus JB14]